MRRRWRLAVACTVMAPLVCAGACSRGATRSLRIVWAQSGQPAGGLRVQFSAAPDAQLVERITTGRGAAEIPPERGALRIVDPASALVLYDAAAPTGDTIAVAEPVKLRGRLDGARQDTPPTVRIGSGRREAIQERWLRASSEPAPAVDRDATFFGLALPPSASIWESAAVTGDDFLSGWVTADAPFQVVAFDQDGRLALRDVAVPAGIQPRTTVDIGLITFRATAGLDVALSLPAADLPLSFVLGIDAATVEADDREEAARHLSVLDQIDPRLCEWLVMRRGYAMLLDGRVRLRGLPPLSRAQLNAFDPLSYTRGGADVALARGSVASIDIPIEGSAVTRSTIRRTVSGILRAGAAGATVAGATVVLADYPERKEARTDAQGRFAVPDVRVDRPFVIFVDASRAAVPAGYPATFLFRSVDPGADIALELPRAEPSDAVNRGPRSAPSFLTTNPEWCPFGTTVSEDFEENVIEATDLSGKVIESSLYQLWAIDSSNMPVKLVASITVPDASKANPKVIGFLLATTPFMVFRGQGTFTSSGSFPIDLVPVNPFQKLVKISVFGPDGKPAAGVTLDVQTPIGDIDPVQLETDSKGEIAIACINLAKIAVAVRETAGCFDKEIAFTSTRQGAVVNLEKCK